MTVPGSFELVFGAAQMAKSGKVDAVIAIGCVIRGDTPHFDYICEGATQGLAELNTTGDVPVIYGLLTCNNLQQAQDRAGGILGNKGDECAVTAIKMVDYKRRIKAKAITYMNARNLLGLRPPFIFTSTIMKQRTTSC